MNEQFLLTVSKETVVQHDHQIDSFPLFLTAIDAVFTCSYRSWCRRRNCRWVRSTDYVYVIVDNCTYTK